MIGQEGQIEKDGEGFAVVRAADVAGRSIAWLSAISYQQSVLSPQSSVVGSQQLKTERLSENLAL